MIDCTYFIQVGAGITTIADTLLWAGLCPHYGVCFTKEIYFHFLVCYSLSKFNLILHFLAVSSKVVNATLLISMILLLAYNHNVICNENHLCNSSKTLVKFALKNITSYSNSKWHNSVSESANLSIEGSQE